MEKFEYKVVSIEFSTWTGRAKEDYLNVLNDMGIKGWRFVQFTPTSYKPKGAKGIEMVFERKILDSNLL